MKRKLTLIILLAISFSGFAQSQTDSNYSLGIKLLSIEETPKLLNEVRGGSTFYTSGLNGFMFKIHDNQISYRLQFNSYKNDNYSFNNECENCEVVSGNYKALDIKLGFERSLIYSKFQPFYGIDLGYKRVAFNGDANSATTTSFMYNANVEKNGALLNPFIGFKFNFIKAITLSAEAGIDFIYTYDKEIKSDASGMVISVNNFKRSQFSTKPLGLLSLQYNFGDN